MMWLTKDEHEPMLISMYVIIKYQRLECCSFI